MTLPSHTPFLLLILDGWGHRVDPKYNAIVTAQTPNWNQLWEQYPHLLIEGSGTQVGLPEGQMGNSEVGHLNIGAGRIVYQDFTRIEQAILTGEFSQNSTLLDAIQLTKQNKSTLHILGLLSPGGVHSHEQQLMAMIELAAKQGANSVYLHAFLDGRDTPPQSAMASLEKVQVLFDQLQCGRIASIIGRYYAMDRDKRWDRVEQAYDLLTLGKANHTAISATDALASAYARGETDEFVSATIVCGPNQSPVVIEDNDVVIFMNFRADRARQLTQAFTDNHFTGFERKRTPKLSEFVTLTQYADTIKAAVAYPPQSLHNVLGEYLSNLGWKQLRIAETEKYAHVTFFFNGGVETPFPGEERLLIPSPKVATYDEQPEMSAPELTNQLVAAIKSQKYPFIVCNFANPDMVGHTGNFHATQQAIECIDQCIGRIVHALKEVGGEVLITADHGNAECMFDEETQQPHTAHTSDPVPLLYIGRPANPIETSGKLSDIAPTLLSLLGIAIPEEMSGKPLFQLD